MRSIHRRGGWGVRTLGKLKGVKTRVYASVPELEKEKVY